MILNQRGSIKAEGTLRMHGHHHTTASLVIKVFHSARSFGGGNYQGAGFKVGRCAKLVGKQEE